MALGNWLSVNEVAEILGLTVGRIRQLLLSGELRGFKVNERAWAIDRKEVEKFAKSTARVLHPCG